MWQKIWNFIINPISIGSLKLFFSPLDIILKLVFPLLGAVILYKIIILIFRKILEKPGRLRPETREKVLKYTKRILKILFLIGLVVIITAFMGEEIRKYLAFFWTILYTPFINSDTIKISIITILLTIPVFILSSWISKKVREVVDNSLLKPLNLQESTKFSISKLIRYGVLTLLLIFGLSLIGIDFSSLTVILGVFGFGIGFGLQNIVGNFFAGLVIFFEQPVKEGDRIIVGGVEGDILRIRMLSTVIITLNNEHIFIPNSQLTSNSIHNYSYTSPQIILVNRVQVSYHSDMDLVFRVLLEVAAENPYALAGKTHEARLISFDDSGITMELRTWITYAAQKQQAHSWCNFRIWKAFRDNQVEIPFPQLDLHVKRLKAPQT